VKNSLGEAAEEGELMSTNTVVNTAAGPIKCDTTVIGYTATEIKTNTSKFHGTGVGIGRTGSHVGECELNNGLPVKVHIDVTELHVTPGAIFEKVDITYAVTLPTGTIECTLSGETSGSYEEGSDSYGFEGSLVGSGTGCPTAGSISGNYTMTDEFGEPVELG